MSAVEVGSPAHAACTARLPASRGSAECCHPQAQNGTNAWIATEQPAISCCVVVHDQLNRVETSNVCYVYRINFLVYSMTVLQWVGVKVSVYMCVRGESVKSRSHLFQKIC